MAITPAVLIATKGLISGEALAVNSVMTGVFSKVSSNPLVSNIEQLKTLGYSSLVTPLPTFMTGSQSAITSATARAQAILPTGAAGTKTFVGLFGGASSLGSMSASYNAAIAQYQGKSFSDLGVGANSFKSLLSNNVSNTFPNLKTAAALGGAATMLGSNISNFGTAYDFKSPANLGAKNLIQTLNKQGLTSKVGINDALSAAGYDINNLNHVPDSVLHGVLGTVQGNDLQHILVMTGAKPYSSLNSLADMTDVNKMMHPEVVKSLGIRGGSPGSIAGLGNKLNNLGAPMDASKLQGLMHSSEFRDFSHLDALSTPLPASVSSSLRPLLGKGNGMFGNPTMTDMIGSASGAHTVPFKNIHDTLGSVASTSQGQDLNNKLSVMVSAVQGGDSGTIAAAQSALNSSVSNFNSFTNSSTAMQSMVSKANSSLTDSTAHLDKESSNMLLAGKDLSSIPAAGNSVMPVLNFASKLHTFGVDKMGVGYNDVLGSVSADNLYGDALNSALLEGRNLSRTSYVGKIASSVSDQSAANQAAAQDSLASAETQVKNATAAAKDGSPENADTLARAQANLDAVKRMASQNPLA
jgi:hypothetical protein